MKTPFEKFTVSGDGTTFGEFLVSVTDCAFAPDMENLEEKQRQFVESAIREKLEKEATKP